MKLIFYIYSILIINSYILTHFIEYKLYNFTDSQPARAEWWPCAGWGGGYITFNINLSFTNISIIYRNYILISYFIFALFLMIDIISDLSLHSITSYKSTQFRTGAIWALK